MAIQHLIENFTITSENVKRIPIVESNSKLICEGKEYIISEGYKFPIWRLDKKNLNERIYPKRLAEKICKENKVTYGLVDHPKDEGSFKDIWSIEKNPTIEETPDGPTLFAEFYLVGNYGKGLIKDILDVPGAGVGLSSSAYGEVGKDGIVQVDGFEVERYADAVLNPSYSVYGYGDNTIDTNSVKESIKEENKDQIINKQIKEGYMTTDKKLTAEERVIRLNIKNLIKEADNKSSLEEKYSSYNEIMEYFDDENSLTDLKEEVGKKINELNEKTKELAKKGEKHDVLLESQKSLKESLKEITEQYEFISKKYEVAIQILEGLKKFSNKFKELYESQKSKTNSMFTGEDYRKLREEKEETEKELKDKEDEIEKKETENKEMKESLGKLKKQLTEKINFIENQKLQCLVQEEYEVENEKNKKEEDEKEAEEKENEKIINEELNGLDIRQTKEITEYYKDLVESNENYKDYADIILGCKTLKEAMQKALKVGDLVDRCYVKKQPIKESQKEAYRVPRFVEREINGNYSIDNIKRKEWL